MYKVTYRLETIGNYSSFIEAFDALAKNVLKSIDEGEMSWQVLETACWISGPSGNLLFYEARDKAIKEFGWSKERLLDK